MNPMQDGSWVNHAGNIVVCGKDGVAVSQIKCCNKIDVSIRAQSFNTYPNPCEFDMKTIQDEREFLQS